MVSNPAGAGAGFGENLFWGHRTICLMKLTASTMLPAATNIQYSSGIHLLRHFQPVFEENCGTTMDFFLFLSCTNTPLDRSAAVVSSVIN